MNIGVFRYVVAVGINQGMMALMVGAWGMYYLYATTVARFFGVIHERNATEPFYRDMTPEFDSKPIHQ